MSPPPPPPPTEVTMIGKSGVPRGGGGRLETTPISKKKIRAQFSQNVLDPFRRVRMGVRGEGVQTPPLDPTNVFPLYFLLASLSERLLKYEETPTLYLQNSFFFFF